MFLIAFNIDDQFITNLLIAQVIASHLHFNDYGFLFEQKVCPSALASVAWYILLCAHIGIMQFQNRVQDILDIIFVIEDYAGTIGMPVLQLFRKCVKLTSRDSSSFRTEPSCV